MKVWNEDAWRRRCTQEFEKVIRPNVHSTPIAHEADWMRATSNTSGIICRIGISRLQTYVESQMT